MTKKNGLGANSPTCQAGEIAAIVCARGYESVSGAALLARTITNTPANERRVRGLPA